MTTAPLALTRSAISCMPAMSRAAETSRRMSLVPMNRTTCVTPGCDRTSRSSRSSPGGLFGAGRSPSRVIVFPPMPSFTTALCASGAAR